MLFMDPILHLIKSPLADSSYNNITAPSHLTFLDPLKAHHCQITNKKVL